MQENHLRSLILKLLQDNTELTFNEIAAKVNIRSDAFIRKVLNDLTREGWVQYEKSQPRKYKLTKRGAELLALEENH